MSSKRKLKEEKEGSIKKLKIVPNDPFKDRYAEMVVEIPNVCILEACTKFFQEEGPNPLRFEIKSYKSELNGTAKTICGETLFVEDCRLTLTLIYEKDKKDKMTELLDQRFPLWSSSNK